MEQEKYRIKVMESLALMLGNQKVQGNMIMNIESNIVEVKGHLKDLNGKVATNVERVYQNKVNIDKNTDFRTNAEDLSRHVKKTFFGEITKWAVTVIIFGIFIWFGAREISSAQRIYIGSEIERHLENINLPLLPTE